MKDASHAAAGTRTVLLVPKIDLHIGCHNSILDNPPSGTKFEIHDSDHLFAFPEAAGSPHESFHLCELIEMKETSRIVHSAFWPVIGARSWVVDTDDLVYPVTLGRTVVNPDFREALARGLDGSQKKLLAMRTENMLSAYSHPSCAQILLRGHPRTCLDVAKEWFGYLGLASHAQGFFEKISILRPAQKPIDMGRVREKWESNGPLRVIFCGRQFESKNGHLALQVISRIRAKEPSVEFTYIGDIPQEFKVLYPELLDGIRHFKFLKHDLCLEIMADSHILFHPSKYESIGLVFLEAAAAGMAVVTAKGVGMDYVEDLFEESGALLVNRIDEADGDEAEEFEQLLTRLVQDLGLARDFAFRNYELTTTGLYSVSAQTKTLAYAYDLAGSRSGDALAVSDLPHAVASTVRRLPSRDVERDEQEFKQSRGITEMRIVI